MRADHRERSISRRGTCPSVIIAAKRRRQHRRGGEGCVPVIWVDDGVLPETPLARVDRPDDVVASSEEDIVDAVAWS